MKDRWLRFTMLWGFKIENTFSYLGWVVVDDHGIFLILKNKDIIYFRITQKHCKPYNNKEKWS